MKNFIVALLMLTTINSWANIEEMPGMETEPSMDEIVIYRSCFSKLESLGCGHPRDDKEKFRQCLNNIFDSLDSSCKKTMKELYGN